MRSVAQRVAIIAGMLLAAGCAHQNAGNVQDNLPVYAPSRHGSDASAQFGVVSAIRQTSGSKGSASGAGAALGAIAGLVIGREFGTSGDGKATGMVLGAMGGAIIGNEIEKDQNGRRSAIRVSVQMDGGGTRVFELADVADLRVGDRVRIDNNKLYRL